MNEFIERLVHHFLGDAEVAGVFASGTLISVGLTNGEEYILSVFTKPEEE